MTTEAFRLDGKHALVTGGASGIGEATCKELARAGASVIIADINLEKAQALAAALPRAKAVHLDVTKLSSIEAADAIEEVWTFWSTTPELRTWVTLRM